MKGKNYIVPSPFEVTAGASYAAAIALAGLQ